jgi:hypothetical protein
MQWDLLFVITFTLILQVQGSNESVRLNDIDRVVGLPNALTQSKRLTPQLQCEEGACRTCPVKAIICTNLVRGSGTQWECVPKGLPSGCQLSYAKVYCDGVTGMSNAYVVNGGCHIKYGVVGQAHHTRTPSPTEESAFLFPFVLFWSFFILFIVYAFLSSQRAVGKLHGYDKPTSRRPTRTIPPLIDLRVSPTSTHTVLPTSAFRRVRPTVFVSDPTKARLVDDAVYSSGTPVASSSASLSTEEAVAPPSIKQNAANEDLMGLDWPQPVYSSGTTGASSSASLSTEDAVDPPSIKQNAANEDLMGLDWPQPVYSSGTNVLRQR